MDLGLPSGEPILRCHITDGAVQSYRVVVIHVELNQAARILDASPLSYRRSFGFR